MGMVWVWYGYGMGMVWVWYGLRVSKLRKLLNLLSFIIFFIIPQVSYIRVLLTSCRRICWQSWFRVKWGKYAVDFLIIPGIWWIIQCSFPPCFVLFLSKYLIVLFFDTFVHWCLLHRLIRIGTALWYSPVHGIIFRIFSNGISSNKTNKTKICIKTWCQKGLSGSIF